MRFIEDFSAGGVATTDRGEIAVVVTTGLNGTRVIGLPKGHPETGETPLSAALREVSEETGLDVIALDGPRYRDTEYWFEDGNGDMVHKRVRFFAMRVVGGDISQHDHEVVEVRVVYIADALLQLTYETDRGVVRALCG